MKKPTVSIDGNEAVARIAYKLNEIIEKAIPSYVIDAYKEAGDKGVGCRINTIMYIYQSKGRVWLYRAM